MWPLLLDLSKDDCRKMLRKLELEAYSGIVSAFRAQGDLTKDKKKSLMDLCAHLGVSPERHKAEIRRAVNDEKLATIADQISGSSVASEWALEGRRLVPLMPRLVPQTAFTAVADNVASVIGTQNAMLPSPSFTSKANLAAQDFGNSHKLSDELSKSQQMLNEGTITAESVPTKNSIGGLNSDLQNIPPVKSSSQSQVRDHLPSSGSSNSNVGILAIGANIEPPVVDKSSRRKRSASVDVQAISPKTLTLSPANAPSTKATSITSSSGQRTVSIPIGGTPVQFTLTGSNQKSSPTTSPTMGSTPQKVILVSTSCSNLPSSLLQRSVGVPIVKTVTTTSTTVSLPQSQHYSKTTAVIVPVSSQGSGIMTTANSVSVSSSTTVGGISPKTTVSTTTSSLTVSKLSARQRVKQGILVPVVTQTSTSGVSSSGKTIQIKPGTKPSFHIKEGSGLKIIAQTVPVAGGAKVLTKSSGSSGGPPIVVVTKTASLTSGGQQGARVVNVLTTQAGGKVITPTSLTLSKASGSGPTFVTVGQKGKQAALVKVSPTMSLSSTGGKPNVIVVQKAHMLQHSQEGSTNVVAFSTASNVQSAQKINLSTIVHEAKGKTNKQIGPLRTNVSSWMPHSAPSEKPSQTSDNNIASSAKIVESNNLVGENSDVKSTVLADLLQAAGILPGNAEESLESVEQTQSVVGNQIHSWDLNENLPSVSKVALGAKDPSSSKLILTNVELVQNQPIIETDCDLKSPTVAVESVNIIPNMSTKSSDALTDVTTSGAELSKNLTQCVNSTESNHDKQIAETEQGELDPKTGVFYSSSHSDGESAVAKLNSSSIISETKTCLGESDDANMNHLKVTDVNMTNVIVESSDSASVAHLAESESKSNNDVIQDDLRSLSSCDRAEKCTDTIKPASIVSVFEEKENNLLMQQNMGIVEENLLIQENVVCEEVPFDDTVVQMEDMMVTIEDMASEVVETSEAQILDQNVVVEQLTDQSEIVETEHELLKTSLIDAPPNVTTDAASANNVKDLNVLSSGSSIFMVTDSVIESESPEVQVVAVPLSEDTDSCDEGSSTNLNSEQEDANGNSQMMSSSTSHDDSTTPTKRKRKPVTQVYSGGNLPHLSGWSRLAMGLLLKVMKFRGTRRVKGEAGACHWFLQPVTDDEAPGYSQIVKFPMDFSTIKKRLETQYYEDISEFHRDMILVKHNCELYNPPDHEARLDCDEVFSFYQQEYDRLTEKWVKTHLMSPQRKKTKL